jgi:hypothetical protein
VKYYTLKESDIRRRQSSRDEIHETHSRIQLITKNEDIVEEIKVDSVENKLAQY